MNAIVPVRNLLPGTTGYSRIDRLPGSITDDYDYLELLIDYIHSMIIPKTLRVLFTLMLGLSALSVSAQKPGLFDSDDVLPITLSGNISELVKDRAGEPKYFEVTLSYPNDDGTVVSIPIRARTRGNFRRAKNNCSYPPILLNFSKENTKNTVFHHQDKVKLVVPCQGDKFVVREYLVYKLYNLITPYSFHARLVQFVFDDATLKEKDKQPMYGILLEEEDQMAKRNNAISIDRQLVRPELTQAEHFLNMAVFEYLIGNTDWSVQYRQNVKLIAEDSSARPITVPYDFDHSGMVWAPYAKPAEALLMSSVRERRYRGFCVKDMSYYSTVLARFNALKGSIYELYTSNTLIDEGYRKATLKYLDEFYKIINDPKRVKEEFQYPCREDGTGNVVIKGLNKE